MLPPSGSRLASCSSTKPITAAISDHMATAPMRRTGTASASASDSRRPSSAAAAAAAMAVFKNTLRKVSG